MRSVWSTAPTLILLVNSLLNTTTRGQAKEGRSVPVWFFFQTQKLNIIATITVATGSCRIVPFENHLGEPHLFSGCFVIVFRLFLRRDFPVK